MKPIQVLIADDHPVLRDALQILINAEPDMQVVGQANDGAEAIALATTLQPTVILLDLVMPGMDGVAVVRAICTAQPQARILVFTSLNDEQHVLPVIQAGATGYLTKNAPRPEILTALRQVAAGEPYLAAAVMLTLFQSLRASAPLPTHAEVTPNPTNSLTPREQEVLTLLGQGLTNAQIAAQLSISLATVRSHIHRITTRLGLQNRMQAVVFASQHKGQ